MDGALLGDDPQTQSLSNTPRATIKNPIYGLVEGVKRGNVIYGKWVLLAPLRHLTRQHH